MLREFFFVVAKYIDVGSSPFCARFRPEAIFAAVEEQCDNVGSEAMAATGSERKMGHKGKSRRCMVGG